MQDFWHSSENCSKMFMWARFYYHVSRILHLGSKPYSALFLAAVLTIPNIQAAALWNLSFKMSLASTSMGSEWPFKNYASCSLDFIHEAVSKSQFLLQIWNSEPAAETLVVNVLFASPTSSSFQGSPGMLNVVNV